MHFASRMHYVIMNGGEAPNVVPDRAKGAALATGTKLAEVRVLAAAHQSHHNKALAALLQRNIEMIGMPKWSEEEHQFARALQRSLGARKACRQSPAHYKDRRRCSRAAPLPITAT